MIEVAKEAAIRSGEKILSLRGKHLAVKSKERLGDFATEADEIAEKIILEILQKNFPKHNFLSEEIGKINKGSEYTWVIDPLDGTIPFTSGMPGFGTSIGLLKKNKPILGVINLPALDILLWAEKGGGAFLNGEKRKVNKERKLIKSVVGFDFAYIGSRREELERFIAPIVDKVRYPPNLACACLGASYVAIGVYEAYLHSAHPWDYVAGAVIVEEAGGKVTDFMGKPIDWSKDWIDFFASNGVVHEKILSLIK
jgi:myo-inositol-1(or 4)-monophosphatase